MGFWNKPTSALTPEEHEARKAYARAWHKAHPGRQAASQKRHYERHPEKFAAMRAAAIDQHRERGYGSRYRDKVRNEVLTHYGNGTLACVLCGFDHPDALCLDHINDDGKAHRAEIGVNLYSPLRKAGYPPGMQTVCQNCNWIKEKARRRAIRDKPRPTPEA